MLTAENNTPVLDSPQPCLPEEPADLNASNSVTTDDGEGQSNQSMDNTEADEKEEVTPVTGSLPSVLPTMPDTSWDDDEDFVDIKNAPEAGLEDEGVFFDPFESILTNPTAGLNLDLDPAVARALRNRSIDEIIAEDGLEHAEAILKAEEEEALRLSYFRTESPERAEQVRLEKEAIEQQEQAERDAKRKAIADRAEHRVKARMFGRSALACGVLAIVTLVASVLMGGA